MDRSVNFPWSFWWTRSPVRVSWEASDVGQDNHLVLYNHCRILRTREILCVQSWSLAVEGHLLSISTNFNDIKITLPKGSWCSFPVSIAGKRASTISTSASPDSLAGVPSSVGLRRKGLVPDMTIRMRDSRHGASLSEWIVQHPKIQEGSGGHLPLPYQMLKEH